MMARRGEAVWIAPHAMGRNTASAPFGPSRRASCGVRTVGSPRPHLRERIGVRSRKLVAIAD